MLQARVLLVTSSIGCFRGRDILYSYGTRTIKKRFPKYLVSMYLMSKVLQHSIPLFICCYISGYYLT